MDGWGAKVHRIIVLLKKGGTSMEALQKRKCDIQELNHLSIYLPKEAFAPEACTFWIGMLVGATAFAIIANNSN